MKELKVNKATGDDEISIDMQIQEQQVNEIIEKNQGMKKMGKKKKCSHHRTKKMVGVYCAVEGCWDSKEWKHRFRNPSNLNLFNTWVELCGNKRLLEVTLGQVLITVCSLHFTKSDFTTNNQLNRQGYPKLQLPGNPTNSSNISNDQQIPPTYDRCIRPMVVQPPLLHVDEISPLLDNNVVQPTTSINFNTDDQHVVPTSDRCITLAPGKLVHNLMVLLWRSTFTFLL
ncbi:hypothetical protein FQA39_LY07371 [Lamprigera yunnana]|nr:hypothetical protein FQA39_LY07371 [Lamprigera yunnana]